MKRHVWWIVGAAVALLERVVNINSGTRILLIGHLDTVVERDSPFRRFERTSPAEARGPGIIDMKGGDVIVVQAPRRGTSSWTLRVTGTPAHSSQVFRQDIGPGAIFEAARILNGFREKLAGEEHLTFNPGAIVGGTDAQYDAAQARGSAAGKDNVVAGRVVVTGDLRALSRDQFDHAKKATQAVVTASMPHTQVGMVLGGAGLMGRDGHTPQETADLTTLPSQTKRAALLLLRLARGESLSK